MSNDAPNKVINIAGGHWPAMIILFIVAKYTRGRMLPLAFSMCATKRSNYFDFRIRNGSSHLTGEFAMTGDDFRFFFVRYGKAVVCDARDHLFHSLISTAIPNEISIANRSPLCLLHHVLTVQRTKRTYSNSSSKSDRQWHFSVLFEDY